MDILIAIAILGGLGLVFGLVLAAASKVFYCVSLVRYVFFYVIICGSYGRNFILYIIFRHILSGRIQRHFPDKNITCSRNIFILIK